MGRITWTALPQLRFPVTQTFLPGVALRGRHLGAQALTLRRELGVGCP
jgi:hypothetical protein